MKKVILLIVCCLSLSSITKSQESIGVYYKQIIDFNNFDHFHLNFSTGIKSNIKISQKSGLKLALGWEHAYYDYTHQGRILDMLYVDYLTKNSFQLDIHYIYDFYESKTLTYYALFGSGLNICISEEAIYNYSLPEKNENIYLQNCLATIGFGAKTKMGENWFFNIGPTISIPVWTSNHSKYGWYKTIPYAYRFSLDAGLSYKF